MTDKGSFFYYAGIIFLVLAIAMSGLLFGVIAVHEDENDGYNQDEDELDYEDFEDQNSIQICCAWGDEIEDGTLTKSVEIYFRDDGGHKAGETRNYFDGYGFLTKSRVIVSEAAFGFGFNIHQLEQITKHEIGHVLGLGHSTFDGSLMTRKVDPDTGSVSDCEINAVYKAQHWKFEEESIFPDYPEQEYVECNM